jgi:hypothetical protein
MEILKSMLLTKYGIYKFALVIGLLVYLADISIIYIVGFIAPSTASWMDEVLLLTAIGGLCLFAWKKHGATWHAIPLILIGIFGFNVVPATGVLITYDKYKAKVTTAGIDESKRGKENIFTAKIVPLNESDETAELHRAQDSYVLWPVYWWARSADTRAKLKEAEKSGETKCITEYGIRNGTFVTLYPNVVKVEPVSACD